MDISSFDILGWLPALLLGLGLAASSGLRAFLPLLMLALAAHWKVAGIELSGPFAWLSSPLALGTLSVATIIEVAGDKIPVVDHFLDGIGTIVRPLAGTLAAAAVIQTKDPATAALIGLVVAGPVVAGPVVAGPVALSVHSAKAGTRGVSSATTLGVANPIVSIFEDITAFLVGLLALLAPLLVPLMLVCLGVVGYKVVMLAKRLKARRANGQVLGS